MSIKLISVFFAFMAVCSKAAVVPEATATVKSLDSARPDFDPTPQYSFSYDVSDSKTGDTKAQSETRTGDVVKGSYSVVEPDGTRRTVYYVASPENGFQAVIRRDSPLEAAAAAAAAASQRTSGLNN